MRQRPVCCIRHASSYACRSGTNCIATRKSSFLPILMWIPSHRLYRHQHYHQHCSHMQHRQHMSLMQALKRSMRIKLLVKWQLTTVQQQQLQQQQLRQCPCHCNGHNQLPYRKPGHLAIFQNVQALLAVNGCFESLIQLLVFGPRISKELKTLIFSHGYSPVPLRVVNSTQPVPLDQYSPWAWLRIGTGTGADLLFVQNSSLNEIWNLSKKPMQYLSISFQRKISTSTYGENNFFFKQAKLVKQ